MTACTDIDAALARLEAKIDGIPRVNEQSIIQNVLGQIGSSPIILDLNGRLNGLAGKTNSLGNSLENLRYTTNSLGERVGVVTQTAQNAKGAVDSLGRNVIDVENRLGGLGNKVVDLDQKTGGLLSRFQELNSNVNGVLSKLSPLFNIVGLVGALAGLASLAGLLYAVFPRLDGHDAELAALNQGNSDAITQAQLGIAEARKADSKAQFALIQNANQQGQIDFLDRRYLDAVNAANAANLKADRATTIADAVNVIANGADIKASNSLEHARQSASQSTTAVAIANDANSKAISATVKTVELANQVVNVEGRTDNLEVKVGSAITSYAEAKSQSSQAIIQSGEASIKADKASAQSTTALATGNNALATSSTALSVANTALSNSLKIYEPKVYTPIITNVQVTPSPNAQPISIGDAFQQIQDKFNQINKENSDNLAAVRKEALDFATKIRQDFQNKISNLILPPASAAEPIPQQRFEAAASNSPIVQNLQQQINQVKNNQILETTVNQQAIDKLNQIESKVAAINQNLPKEVKLDSQVTQKIDRIDSTTQTNQSLLTSLQGIVSYIQSAVNSFIAQVNNLANQINAFIGQLNAFISRLNDYLADITRSLTAINQVMIDFGLKLTSLLAIGTFIQPLVVQIAADTTLILTRLGSTTLTGGVTGWLSNLGRWIGASRFIEMITLAGVFHNAFMLSNDVGHTFFAIIDNLINIPIAVANPNGESFNSQEFFGKGIKDFLKGLLGEKNYEALVAEYKALNTIISTSSNILTNVQSIVSDTQDIQNITNDWVRELGDALRDDGVISEENWEAKPEKPRFKSKLFGKLERMSQGLEAVNTALQAVEQVTANLKSVVDAGNEIKQNLTDLDNELAEAKTAAKTLYDATVKAVEDKADEFSLDDLY